MTTIIARPVLPNEPRIVDAQRQQTLTDRFLTPMLAQLETFFLAVRAQIDAELQPRQPVKLGKPYPLGQCLEITKAVQLRLSKIAPGSLPGPAATGHSALTAFLRAGGALRQVWGDLRGQFFQNAFLIGTLYVDVSNDTVTPTKPKVEILPFADADLTPIRDYLHFKTIAERYWQDEVYPNHLLPELAPFFPLIHVSPRGTVRLGDTSQYMLSFTQATVFRSSEAVLDLPAMPPELFKRIAAVLRDNDVAVAADTASGRTRALANCRQYRAKRWHHATDQVTSFVQRAWDINIHLTPFNAHAARTAQDGVPPPDPANAAGAANYVPLDAARHAGKRWLRDGRYPFAARDALVPMQAHELPQAMLSLPLAFVAGNDDFDLVAVQGLEPGVNALVDSDGRWLAAHVPTAYRCSPFLLAPANNGEHLVCIDEHSSVISDGPDGERLMDDSGAHTPALTELIKLLTQQHAGRAATATICALLNKHQLIQPWPIRLQHGERMHEVQGLYRVNEAALNALPAEALTELRDSGALVAAYCQMLAMQHLPKLSKAAS